MERFLLRAVLGAVAVLVTASLPQTGVEIYGARLEAALVFAVVLGLLNGTVRPLLLLLTLPLNLVTLGLFTLVVNAVVFWLASLFPIGVRVDGLRGAFVGSLMVSAVSFVASRMAR